MTVIATFDAKYGRGGEIRIECARCDICGNESPLCLVVDSSEGEYNPGRICECCVLEALATAIKAMTDPDP